MTLPRLVLAIESAVAGGSLSLLRDGSEIANWTGTAEVSKGEDLLFNIDAMLKGAGVEKKDIGQIAVSAGPGSFTGIRIGIATALGLKNGLGVEMSSVSALRAIIVSSEQVGHPLVAAIPMGRNAFCFQQFDIANGELVELHEPRTAPLTSLADTINETREATFLLHSSLVVLCPDDPRVIDAGSNIARSVGVACALSSEPFVEGPLFISKSF